MHDKCKIMETKEGGNTKVQNIDRRLFISHNYSVALVSLVSAK